MAKKNTPNPKPAPNSGTLMGMRSGFQKMTGSKRSRNKPSKWTFQQVLMAFAGTALLIAIIYAMSR